MGSLSTAPVIQHAKRDGSRLVLWTAVLALEAALVVFSQTFAGYADEGLHLMAAQLISLGRRPYLDFFFQHPPLYAYLNGAWLRVFGSGWRGPHVLAALLTGGAILLVADFVHSRLHGSAWRLAAAITAALFMGLNTLVVQYGTISQPYGACLFFGAAAFRLTAAAVQNPSRLLAWWAGLGAGAGAASSMLAAPVAPILLAWLVRRSPHGNRLKRCVHFLVGSAVPFLPVLWLAARGPRQVLFDLIQFHLSYRGLAFRPPFGLAKWDLSVVAGGLLSTQSLVLVGLAVLCVAETKSWRERERSELYLCAALVIGLALVAAGSHPVFEQYFVLATPFLAVLAAMGLYSIGSRLWPGSPAWVTLAVVGLFSLHTYQQRRVVYPCWQQIEATARAINEVAPAGDFYSDYEAVYFAARRVPPPGLENRFAPVLRLLPALAASLHVVAQPEIDRRLAEGEFAAVLIAVADPDVESLGLKRVYSRQREVTCYNRPHYLFWDPAPPPK